MKKFILALSLAALAASPALAEVKKGAFLYDASGRRIGQIDRVLESGDLWVIHGGQVKTVPGSTVSDNAGKATTTLTVADIRKL